METLLGSAAYQAKLRMSMTSCGTVTGRGLERIVKSCRTFSAMVRKSRGDCRHRAADAVVADVRRDSATCCRVHAAAAAEDVADCMTGADTDPGTRHGNRPCHLAIEACLQIGLIVAHARQSHRQQAECLYRDRLCERFDHERC